MNHENPTIVVDSHIADLASDIKTHGWHDIHSPKELAAISQYAHNNGMYDARYEAALALSLKNSMASGVYKRMSVPTPPPASLAAALRNRV